MATIDKSDLRTGPAIEPLDPEGFPWLENGERMDWRTFLERYEQAGPHVRAELIGGIVYVMASPLKIRHGRAGNHLSGCIFLYSAATPGSEGQDNATTVLGDESVPQPDSALLILEEYGGQSREGDDGYSHGAPELLIEVALSSRSNDLHSKLRDYERAGVREYLVHDLRRRSLHWFERSDGHFEPMKPDPDGIYRSKVFPGFWIDPASLVAADKTALVATLRRGLDSPEHAAFVAELERRRAERAARP